MLFFILLLVPSLVSANKIGIVPKTCEQFGPNRSFVEITLESGKKYLVKSEGPETCRSIINNTIGGYELSLCEGFKRQYKQKCKTVEHKEFVVPVFSNG